MSNLMGHFRAFNFSLTSDQRLFIFKNYDGNKARPEGRNGGWHRFLVISNSSQMFFETPFFS